MQDGKPLVLEAVRRAEQKVVSKPDHEYLGITGIPEFNSLSARLAFGNDSAVVREGRNAIVQALSGTGSLRASSQISLQRLARDCSLEWQKSLCIWVKQ